MESYDVLCCESQREPQHQRNDTEAPKQKNGKGNSMKSFILPSSSQRCHSSKAIGSLFVFRMRTRTRLLAAKIVLLSTYISCSHGRFKNDRNKSCSFLSFWIPRIWNMLIILFPFSFILLSQQSKHQNRSEFHINIWLLYLFLHVGHWRWPSLPAFASMSSEC